ncbi:hypothetical protein M501DRAFT_1057248 [Patellaria atrata CBS 101060]|uniref:Uncharacterized protein n=1 Tax=Patellaria atrata CBS 101060 TaxID=1346257 RepID=A0A9P4SE49_9PEZI|nr:hypothetical protein M501DRAFT_1057248 [Patellaria atrata CBS 101060]
MMLLIAIILGITSAQIASSVDPYVSGHELHERIVTGKDEDKLDAAVAPNLPVYEIKNGFITGLPSKVSTLGNTIVTMPPTLRSKDSVPPVPGTARICEGEIYEDENGKVFVLCTKIPLATTGSADAVIPSMVTYSAAPTLPSAIIFSKSTVTTGFGTKLINLNASAP